MKTINIRKDQLQEVTVAGDVRPGENLGSAAKRTVKDANSELGSYPAHLRVPRGCENPPLPPLWQRRGVYRTYLLMLL